MDHHRLQSGTGGQPDGDTPVVVVVVGEHREDLSSNEERRFAMREPLLAFRHGKADAADSVDRLCAAFSYCQTASYRDNIKISLTEWLCAQEMNVFK